MQVFLCCFMAVLAAAFAMPSLSEDAMRMVEYLKTIQECKKEEKPTIGDLRAIRNNTLSALTSAGKCFVGCNLQKLGILQNGAYSKSTTERLARKKLADDEEKLELALKYIGKCEDDVVGIKPDKCEVGPVVLACIKQFDDAMDDDDED